MHGKVSSVSHDSERRLRRPALPVHGGALPFARRGSDSVPDALIVNATAEDGTVQGFGTAICRSTASSSPESIASEHGHALLRNFLEICRR